MFGKFCSMNLRKCHYFYVLAFILATITSLETQALNINTTENFPDSNFRAAVEEFMGVEPGGEFSAEEAANKSGKFDAFPHRGIADLSGIEFFVGITELWITENLTSVDVSRNTELEILYLWGNQLTSLDVSKNLKLKELYCDQNKLTFLDVSNNLYLEQLTCSGNLLTTLDITNNIELNYLDCGENQLSFLDITNCLKLSDLYCPNNQLTSLDASNNTELISLMCNNNLLIDLKISSDALFNWLEAHDNNLTSLSDLASNLNVTSSPSGFGPYIDIRNNKLDCDVWPELQILIARTGVNSLLFSPQKGIDLYNCRQQIQRDDFEWAYIADGYDVEYLYSVHSPSMYYWRDQLNKLNEPPFIFGPPTFSSYSGPSTGQVQTIIPTKNKGLIAAVTFSANYLVRNFGLQLSETSYIEGIVKVSREGYTPILVLAIQPGDSYPYVKGIIPYSENEAILILTNYGSGNYTRPSEMVHFFNLTGPLELTFVSGWGLHE